MALIVNFVAFMIFSARDNPKLKQADLPCRAKKKRTAMVYFIYKQKVFVWKSNQLQRSGFHSFLLGKALKAQSAMEYVCTLSISGRYARLLPRRCMAYIQH